MSAKLFLTDYASYNNGTQFEFGHWVDLEQFSDAEEFGEYITNHFEHADETSPLPCGSIREEPMFTDFENFPECFYSESGTFEDLFEWLAMDEHEQIKVMVLMESEGYSFEEACESERYIREFDRYGDDKYYIFEEWYPEIPKVEEQNDYLTIDYDRFIDEEFITAEYEGKTYLIDRG